MSSTLREAQQQASATAAVEQLWQRRLVHNVGFLSLSQALTWAASLASTLVVPRILGPSGMGLIVTALAASGLLVAVFGMGGAQMIVKEISAEPRLGPRLVGTAILVRIGLLPFCLGTAIVYAHFSRFQGDQFTVLLLGGGLAAFTLLVQPFLATLQATERMVFLAYSEIINKAVVSLLGILAVVVAGRGATWVVAISVIAAAATLGLNLVWVRPILAIDLKVDWGSIRSFLIGSMAYWATALVFSLYLWIDSTMLSLMAPSRVVGWYGVPTRLWGTMMFIPTILMTAWTPRLAAAFAKSPKQLKQTARMPADLLLSLSLPVGIGMAMVAQTAILTVYGQAFQPSVLVLQILALSTLPTYLNTMACQVLVACNRQLTWTKVLLLAAVINPLLNFVLIRLTQAHDGNGAVGSAVALLITEVILGLFAWFLVYRRLGLGNVRRLARVGLATAVMAVAVFLARDQNLAVQLTVGTLAFFGACFLVGVLTPEERSHLWRFLAARLRSR